MTDPDKKPLADLSIAGSGITPGGIYRKAVISGSGKVQGNISCATMDISGSGKIMGDVDTGTLQISGSGVVDGDVKADSLTINGTSRIEKDVTVAECEVNGRLTIKGSLHGESARSYGQLSIDGDIETEELTVEGKLSVAGLCSADRIAIKLGGGSSAIHEIGCSRLNVHRGIVTGWMVQLFGKIRGAGLTVDTIEGDELFLEDTEVQTVHGSKVVIGAGCRIDKVFYKESYWCANDSQVRAVVKE
ncbi:bactofilin family protein [Sporolactobacillus vineae]|uniref:bactofilin family protein n=1 Tax=Sporolactobacillus vineae TaxID=444463 RepID=UPI0002895A45|nr:polymer-forming cytoskeletal protein [Sporolactobacillus vineae]